MMSRFELLKCFLDSGEVFDVVVKPSIESVMPAYLRGSDEVIFTWGRNMPIPIRDIKLDELALSGTLNFARVGQFWCYLDMNDITAAVQSGRGVRFEETPASRRAAFKVIKGGKV